MSGDEEVQQVQEVPRIEPKQVVYCKICTIPLEYCMYGSSRSKCKEWLAGSDHQDLFARLYPEDVTPKADGGIGEDGLVRAMEGVTVTEDDDSASKHQKRGGKGLPRDQSAKLDKEAQKRAKAKVTILISERNRRKAITTIRGLEVFGLELKKVAKRLAGKYACGCSVVKNPAGIEEIALQGDFMDDLASFLPAEYSEIEPRQIDLVIK